MAFGREKKSRSGWPDRSSRPCRVVACLENGRQTGYYRLPAARLRGAVLGRAARSSAQWERPRGAVWGRACAPLPTGRCRRWWWRLHPRRGAEAPVGGGGEVRVQSVSVVVTSDAGMAVSAIHTEGGVAANGDTVLGEVAALAARGGGGGDRRRVVLVGHSKGGLDALAAVAGMDPATAAATVAGVVCMLSPYGGTPVVGWLAARTAAAAAVAIAVERLWGGDPAAVADMGYPRRAAAWAAAAAAAAASRLQAAAGPLPGRWSWGPPAVGVASGPAAALLLAARACVHRGHRFLMATMAGSRPRATVAAVAV
ncbi:hypothetical protein I4F81_003901 [Pyropia yezoensis]|uniref:Uncharacterized protein n=1 Tax=Pyropia yezoensis TaxID=2788 RepID=A0ACC3BTU0_PYRYE|nr:hypothetical protein I4F81_003901 [Neopyropia yezoensis]